MPNKSSKENSDKETFIIHYDGSKLIDHHMELSDFLESLNGFKDMLLAISNELGIEQNEIDLQISPLEDGGVKANITFILSGIIGMVSGNLADHLADDIHLYERLNGEVVATYINSFLDRKQSASDPLNINILTQGLDSINTRIMLDKNVHNAAERFVSPLKKEADIIKIEDSSNNIRTSIPKEKVSSFVNPFTEQDMEEKVHDEERILRLDGPRSLGSEWLFYEKDNKGKWDTSKIFKAEVLDDFLLSLGRENSLATLKNKDLFCTIRYKEIKKIGNKKKTVEKYIIKCRLEPTFFSEKSDDNK